MFLAPLVDERLIIESESSIINDGETDNLVCPYIDLPETFEAYLAAKVIVDALKKSGKEPTRAAFTAALDASNAIDLGGYVVGFKPNDHNGSKFVDLTVVSGDGKMRQ